MEGLRESMKRWGYLTPIVLDQNNVIADGEHRLAIYKEMGYTEIPAYRLELKNDVERMLVRQAMNKLRGQHDPELDLIELETILNQDKESLKNILNFGEKEFEMLKQFNSKTLEEIEETTSQQNEDQERKYGYQGLGTPVPKEHLDGDRKVDPSTIEHYQDSFLHGNIKQIVIYFKNEEYQNTIEKLQKIMVAEHLTSHTDLIMFLIQFYESSKPTVN